MKLGNLKYFIFLIFFIISLPAIAADKIESVPLINLEELSPTFEEDKDELEKLEKSNTSLNSNENILETQNKYSLTEGLTINKYNNIINEVLKELPDLDEWLNDDIKKKFNNIKWKDAILKVHKLDSKEILKSKYYKRLVFDELFAHFLLSSKIRTFLN